MVTVWIREDPFRATRFHRTPDCHNLRKRPANGQPHKLLEVDLDLVGVRPCLTCYPDAPRIKVAKRYCKKCRSKTPCKHNGGVYITKRDGHHYWVWPDSNQMPTYRRQSIASTTSPG